MANDWDPQKQQAPSNPTSLEQHTSSWPQNAYQQQQQQQVDQNYQQQWYAYYAAQNQQQQQQQQPAISHQVVDQAKTATSVAPPLPTAPPPPPPPPQLVWNGTSYVQASSQPPQTNQTNESASQAGNTASQGTSSYTYGTEQQQYTYGSTSYPSYAYAYPQQGNESYPGPYASAAPYQPPSYQSPTTYYSNNGVYQPANYGTWTDPAANNSSSNYANYGIQQGYSYPNTDAGSNYYANNSEPTVPPGMEAPVSTYASVVAHGTTYPAPPKQPPPPGTQQTWPPPQGTSTSNGHVNWNQGQLAQQATQQTQAAQSLYKSPVKIPMNPRIPHSMPYQRPAYISVAAKPPAGKTVAPENKPMTFPPSLRAYVERALARCKDDAQKTACQGVMKEIITKASSDGTLFTKNWDIEPLFPLPKPSDENRELPNTDRNRKTKSRWEPVENSSVTQSTTLQAGVNKNNLFNQQPKQATPVVTMNWVKRDGPWIKPKTFQPPVPTFQPTVQQQVQSQPQPQLQALQQQVQQPPPLQQQKFQQTYQVQQKQKQKQETFKFTRQNAKRKAKPNGSNESDEEADYSGVTLGSLGTSSNPEESKRRQTRTKRFESCKDNTGPPRKFYKKEAPDSNTYARRATAMRLAMNTGDPQGQAVEDIDWDSLTIKGTCQEIEKRFLRLTSAPDPATVRPEEVLVKALEMVKCTSKNYFYKCEQLKSIRQDLTVQRIRNRFAVQVYETHARTALEAGDLAEYNQCQTQLKGLYADGIEGCYNEFAAYSLLYCIFQNGSNRELLSSMARLSQEAKQDKSVKHALAVRSTVLLGNYISFFRLYKTAPNLNSYLMDLHVEKMRFEALRCMSRSYRPTLPLDVIARNLGFLVESSSESEALEECEEWVKSHGGHIINAQERQFDTKTSSTTLFMPEPEDAVPHGDSNLAVNDFLARSVAG